LFLAFIILISVSILLITKLQSPSGTDTPSGETDRGQLTFTPNDMPTLRQGHYALWGVSGENSTLIKRFNAVNGKLFGLDGHELDNWPLEKSDWSGFFVSIEQEGDRDETPTSYRFLSCTVVQNPDNQSCQLKFSIIQEDATISGSYILATPSDGNTTVNEASGIWFTNTDGTKAGLTLPGISEAGWSWEIRIDSGAGKRVFLGRFRSAEGPDNDNRYSLGDAKTYPFPGEDLLTNLPEDNSGPFNLSSGNYLVTISLEPDNGGFDLSGDHRVLESQIPTNTSPRTSIRMQRVVQNPSIVLEIKP
jgi:hypothetical protein